MSTLRISRRTALARSFQLSIATAVGSSIFAMREGSAQTPRAKSYFAYVGTYTSPKCRGIYGFKYNPTTGECGAPSLMAEADSPSFLAVHPSKPFVYSVNEIDKLGSKPTGGVTAFHADLATGRLTMINQVSSGGVGPCHLNVDRKGRCVLVANYGGGSVASLQIREDGGLSEPVSFIQHKGSSVNPARQKEPHAHSINVAADNRFAFVADLGLDKIFSYRLDAEHALLTPNNPPHVTVSPGSGPRHFAFHPSGRLAYVINEMLCTITAFKYAPETGVLTSFQTVSTLPAGVALKPEYSTAEIVVHPSGRFVFGSNRGHDTIAVFSVSADGSLKPVGHTSTLGRIPRNFAIDPSGDFLFVENQSSDTIIQFKIDRKSGVLVPTQQKIGVPSPVCMRFLAAA